jgi:hypothetical protein
MSIQNVWKAAGVAVRKQEVGESCGTYGENRNAYIVVWWGNPKDRYHLEDVRVDGRILSILRK